MTFTTPRVAAIATLAALGGVGAAALALQADTPAASKPIAAAAAPVEVRTQTIHRTIHVMRHERVHRRARRPSTAGSSPPTGVTASPLPTTATAAAVPAPLAVPAPAPADPQRPLRSRTSASSGRGNEGGEHAGGEREHESGEDD